MTQRPIIRLDLDAQSKQSLNKSSQPPSDFNIFTTDIAKGMSLGAINKNAPFAIPEEYFGYAIKLANSLEIVQYLRDYSGLDAPAIPPSLVTSEAVKLMRRNGFYGQRRSRQVLDYFKRTGVYASSICGLLYPFANPQTSLEFPRTNAECVMNNPIDFGWITQLFGMVRVNPYLLGCAILTDDIWMRAIEFCASLIGPAFYMQDSWLQSSWVFSRMVISTLVFVGCAQICGRTGNNTDDANSVIMSSKQEDAYVLALLEDLRKTSEDLDKANSELADKSAKLASTNQAIAAIKSESAKKQADRESAMVKELADKDREISRLTSLLAKRDDEIATLHQQLEIYEKQFTDSTGEDMLELPELPTSNIVFAGGHPNLVYKIKNLYPDWTYIESNSTTIPPSNPVAVFVYYKSIGHKVFQRLRAVFPTYLITYVQGTNVDLLLDSMRTAYASLLGNVGDEG